MKKMLFVILGIVVAAGVLRNVQAEEGYPLREKFPSVKVISTEALNKDYKKTIIVDVRSKIEFDVIRINSAVHEPITTGLFLHNLEKLRAKTAGIPIAFYCNGHTCAKSYQAAEKAASAGFQNVFAYDSGITDWVLAHPEKTTLMDQTPAHLGKLISHEALAKRRINYREFLQRAENGNTIIIDAREPFQRKVIPPITALRNIQSDRLVELIKKGEFKENQVLIMDAVGKQIEWIQYYLEQAGYSNYYFLDKGVSGAEDAGLLNK